MRMMHWQPLSLSWQPSERIDSLRRQLDQVFDDFTGTSSSQEATWQPPIELMDTPENLVLRVQLPGIDRNQINIQATRNAVLIEGEYPYPQQSDSHPWFRSEFVYGKFRRLIALPSEIDNDCIQADFREGVLTLTLPKPEQARRRVVNVNLGTFADSSTNTTLEAASDTVPNSSAHG